MPVMRQAVVTSLLILLTTMPGSAQAGKDTHRPGLTRHHPSFPVTGMVVLTGDRLLLWHGRGRAQLRDPNGRWSDVFRLPVEEPEPVTRDGALAYRPGIIAIVPDDEGILILDEAPPGEKGFSVLLTNLTGEVLDRWRIEQYALAITSDHQGRRVLTVDGVIPLLPRGTFGDIETFPADDDDHATHHNPLLLEWQGTTIFCRDANLTMADNAPVQCRRLGEGGWHFEQGFGVARPARCGSWLLLWDGINDCRLTVRSLVTGKIISKKTFSQRPVMACAAQDGLWVGIHGVQLLNLPTLTTRWRLAGKTGRIENIVVSETYVAYEEEGAGELNDIVLMARP